MPRFDNVLETKAAKDRVLLQIGKAFYNLDSDRKIFKTYADLPAVGTKYLVVESGTTSTNSLSPYGTEIYYNVIDDNFLEDVVVSNQQTFTITAASDDPELILKQFVNKRHSTNFWFEFFSQFDIGITRISDVTDVSVPVEGGDWEERYAITLEVNYLSKETEIITTIETITGTVTTTGGGDQDDIVDTLNVELNP